ncbi:MAG: DNA-deoxyinosine glycosylase [Chitinophagaceae bacterium]|nr:MAG: DNA-deoxyinosine glycosylase [Chitinophagaceae bacterium]
MICSFPPILPDAPTILILGTMPGARSLEKQEYYAHAQNHFWKIIFRLLGSEVVPETFAERKTFLIEHKIAVWDVLESCEREGSLDANIRNATENPIPELIRENPSIKAVFFNGQESHRIFTRTFGDQIKLPMFVMPSTSPAYTIGFEKKLGIWSMILDFIP